MPEIFQPPIEKKISKAPSVRIIVIYSDHRLLWWDSDKGFDLAITSPEPILHQIMIIIIHGSVLNAYKPSSSSNKC